MALEKWLLEIAGAKDEQSREFARTAFDFLLNRSESVAISGVLSSVAMARPGGDWRPDFAVDDGASLRGWDFHRWQADLTPFAIGGLFEFDKFINRTGLMPIIFPTAKQG